jgi:FtsH-binding integral membrane protein
MALACCVFSIITMFMIVCCFGRKAPLNYVLLFIFTACETFMIGGLTAGYPRSTVCQAGAATALVTISLTVYAMKTKVPIEFFGAISMVICLAMIPLMILSFFITSSVLNTVYCCFGALLYAIYLIIDTMMITGGKNNMSNVKCDMDDYIIGALMLYLDIVMLFVYILRILGQAKN